MNDCLAASECFEVIESESIDVVVATTPLECDIFGTIFLEVSGGSGTYTYLWNDGHTDQNRVNLFEGIYLATITDQNGLFG